MPEPQVEAAAPAPAAQASPMALAMRRFWRIKGARWGVCVVGLFILVAVYAPFITSEIAVFYWDEQGLRFPIFADLFNQRSYPKPHDLLFNLLVFLLPLLLVASWALRRFLRWSWPRLISGGLGAIALVWIAFQIPFLPHGDDLVALWDERPRAEERYERWLALDEAGDAPTAVFPLIPHRYDANYYSLMRPMAVNQDTGRRFLLGTDDRGYDVFARMAFGARISLTIGLVAVGISMAIGIVIGAVSGYFGGLVDLALQRLVEIKMAFPDFILLLTIIAMLGRDIYLIMIVIGLTGWAGTARLVRGEFLREMGREYVLSTESLGLGRPRIMFRHILPNALTPLLISAAFGIAGSILAEAGLAFIGLGDPNAPSWGALLDVGRRNIGYVWLIWVPGLTVFLLVSSLNMIGNAMREALDPKGAR